MPCGKTHTFIRIDIELVKDGEINIHTKSYINEAIKKFGEYVSRGVKSPERGSLFYVTEGADKLLEE